MFPQSGASYPAYAQINPYPTFTPAGAGAGAAAASGGKAVPIIIAVVAVAILVGMALGLGLGIGAAGILSDRSFINVTNQTVNITTG